MDPMNIELIMGGAGLGLVKGATLDRAKEDRQRWLASQTQRYSPWTGLRANPVEEADPFGSAMQGGVQGYAMGQNMENANASKKLADAQTKYLEAMNKAGSPGDAIAMELQGGAPAATVGYPFGTPYHPR